MRANDQGTRLCAGLRRGRDPTTPRAPPVSGSCDGVTSIAPLMDLRIYGRHDARVIAQLRRCVEQEDGARGVLCADGHLGYSAPIGGVVAYREHVSPAAVGYDIGCGNLAVRTDLPADDGFRADLPRLMDRIFAEVSFGVGRRDGRAADHPVIDAIRKAGLQAPAQARPAGRRAARNRGRRKPLRRSVQRRERPRLDRRALRLARLRASHRFGLPRDGQGAGLRGPCRRGRDGECARRPPRRLRTGLGVPVRDGAGRRLRPRGPGGGGGAGARHPRRPPARVRAQPPQLRLARAPRRRRLLRRPQGRDSRFSRPARVRGSDDG